MMRRTLLTPLIAAAVWLMPATLAAEEGAAPPALQPKTSATNETDLSPAKKAINEILQADEFGKRETRRMPYLDFGEQQKKKEEKSTLPQWLRSLADLMKWMVELMRGGVWVLAALVILALLVTIRAWLRARNNRVSAQELALPAAVGGLDIRPESLPQDVGGEAWRLWQRGEHIGALSLLYRGALSALVNRFQARITTSATESECIAAATHVTSGERIDYFRLLTRCWQSAVYAGRTPDTSTIESLCASFSAQFAQHKAVATTDGAA